MKLDELRMEMWPTEKLIEYARNPRQNDQVIPKMVASIKEFGFRIPIVAKSDGTVVDGHLRLKAAREMGLEQVPVVLADELTDTQVKAFRLLANQSANWAEWDNDLLKLELEELKEEDFNVDLIGFELEEVVPLTDMPMDDFFEAPQDTKEKKKKTIVCPHCGEEFELD